MRIAYINTDEVSQTVAAKMARKFGAAVYELNPKDLPTDVRYDAVLLNLDGVPRHRQGEVLAELLRGPWTCPKAIHGYDLSENQAGSLRLQGIAVAQRLQFDLFRILCRAFLQNLTSVPPDDALAEETWIDLAAQPAWSRAHNGGGNRPPSDLSGQATL
jgi:hypothetical protein